MKPANDPSVDYRVLVRDNYDHLAADYDDKRAGEAPPQLALLTSRLAQGAAVLDIGCGAGVPVAKTLAERCIVTGVDISGGMIARARSNVPGATFIHGDITAIDFPPSQFDAAVAFYSIFHLPREEHPDLLRRIYGWLKPGGWLLATLSYHNEAPYMEEYMGQTMFWSNYSLEEYRDLLKETGFTVVEETAIGAGYEDPDDSPEERHPLILARKE
ncbi:MAG: class I SAM-dependent methyltransferase [Dehalococcoidales bacterium]|nr:class I SAM-dependent methyltransferase [Dehalococcoidales bacterium]